MDVKEAVAAAKKVIAELFGPEGAHDIGLEEVEYNRPENEWVVTIGFSRAWDRPENTLAALVVKPPARAYKVVRLTGLGAMISVKSREQST